MSHDYNKQAKRIDLSAVRSILCPPSAERTCDMKTRIFGVKTRYALLLSVALGLTAAGPTMAACDVTLSAILPNNQAVLKADCGTANMSQITWTRDIGLPTAAIFGPYVISPPTRADISFATLLISGTHTYTATGFDDVPAAVTSGKAAVVSLSQPVLTVAVSPGGSVTSAPSGITSCTNPLVIGTSVCAFGFDTDKTVVLTATADSAHSFSTWGGDCSGIGNTCTVSMTAPRTVTATFSTVPTYPLTVTSSGGTVSGTGSINCGSGTGTCSANLASGTAVSLTANPTSPNTMFAWSGNCSGTANPCTFTMGAVAASVSAAFSTAPTYALHVTSSANGSVSGGGISNCTSTSGTCDVGGLTSSTGPTLTASPQPNYSFSWSGGGCSGSGTCTPTLAANQTTTVTANFTAGPTYALTVTTPVNGTVTGTGINCGSTCTVSGLTSSTGPMLTANPASGFTVSGWSGGGCTGTGTTCTPTLSASSTTTVTATFTIMSTGGTGTCVAPSGWTCATNPLTIPNPPAGTVASAPLDISSGRTFVFTASPSTVHAFPIIFDSTHFPPGSTTGASIGAAEASFNRTQRDMVISDAPGSMTPLDSTHFGCRQLNFQEAATIFISFDTAVFGACNLTRDRPYWLNVKATSISAFNTYLLQPFPQ